LRCGGERGAEECGDDQLLDKHDWIVLFSR